tara:strand:- start:811 stop:1026 length:216 start_codon:yes stop_codon:yes gene_type:complete
MNITLKKNIRLVGASKLGINIYEFEYINIVNMPGRYRGVMAHEVPQASIVGENGHLLVDYSLIDVDFSRIF